MAVRDFRDRLCDKGVGLDKGVGVVSRQASGGVLTDKSWLRF